MADVFFDTGTLIPPAYADDGALIPPAYADGGVLIPPAYFDDGALFFTPTAFGYVLQSPGGTNYGISMLSDRSFSATVTTQEAAALVLQSAGGIKYNVTINNNGRLIKGATTTDPVTSPAPTFTVSGTTYEWKVDEEGFYFTSEV